jgi:hypothetical protein
MIALPNAIRTDKTLDWGQVNGLQREHGALWFLTEHEEPAYKPLRVQYRGLSVDHGFLTVTGQITRPDGRIFTFSIEHIVDFAKVGS